MKRWFCQCLTGAKCFTWLSCFALVSWADSTATPSWVKLQASAQWRVGQKQEASQKLITWVESQGGWLSVWDTHHMVLRVPHDRLSHLMDSLSVWGELQDHHHHSQDLTHEVHELEQLIQSKRAMLVQYFELVKNTDYTRVQAVEREVVSLVAEIEGLEGRLQQLRLELGQAEVSVYFQLRERRLPSSQSQTPFQWLNHLDLHPLQEAFQ